MAPHCCTALLGLALLRAAAAFAPVALARPRRSAVCRATDKECADVAAQLLAESEVISSSVPGYKTIKPVAQACKTGEGYEEARALLDSIEDLDRQRGGEALVFSKRISRIRKGQMRADFAEFGDARERWDSPVAILQNPKFAAYVFFGYFVYRAISYYFFS